MEILDAVPALYKDAIVRQFASFNAIVEEPYFILSVGIVAGLVGPFLLRTLLTVFSVFLRILLNASTRLFSYLYQTLVLFGELWMTHVFPILWSLCCWKTYKKVMPWRRTLVKQQESHPRSLEVEKVPKDDLFGSEADIDFFQTRVQGAEGPDWKFVCQKSLGDYLKYDARLRIIQGNKTEYKSTSIIRNSTAEELTAFYLDDARRQQWDGLLAKCELIEEGPIHHRCEVVRWVRSFPFPFLSDREYVIGRRIFKKEGVIYTISKGIRHESVPVTSSVVRMDVYYSMWSCRDIPCPWGSSQPACEVILLHHEQFKIPEKLARFAAVKGMWGFMKSMGPALLSFVQDHREAKARQESLIGASDPTMNPGRAMHGSVQGKPKVIRTVKRALLATVVGTTVFLIRKLNQK